MKINEKHHQTRISTSRRVTITRTHKRTSLRTSRQTSGDPLAPGVPTGENQWISKKSTNINNKTMNINEKHHQRRISTSRQVNIIGQSNFSITFTLRQRGKGTGTRNAGTEDFRTSETPAMGSNIVPSRHTQLRTHARTKRIRFPGWTQPPTSDFC